MGVWGIMTCWLVAFMSDALSFTALLCLYALHEETPLHVFNPKRCLDVVVLRVALVSV